MIKNVQDLRVVIAYKNFAGTASHAGLGIIGLNIIKVLKRKDIHVELWPVENIKDIRARLDSGFGGKPITHLIIFAPWLETTDLNDLCMMYGDVEFSVVVHSNVGFLQADISGTRLIREYMDLEVAVPNFRLAGNTPKFTGWVNRTFNAPCVLLPNLYDLADANYKLFKPDWAGTLLRIGCFGAARPLKNTITAAAAALEMASTLRTDLEFHVSKHDEGANIEAIKELYKDIKGVSLVETSWRTWPGIRNLIRKMDLLMQPSFTESFNLVTADGVAEGVPSVVSRAIDWVPSEWKANSDDAGHIARVGTMLLHDPYAVRAGRDALNFYVELGTQRWITYLTDSYTK